MKVQDILDCPVRVHVVSSHKHPHTHTHTHTCIRTHTAFLPSLPSDPPSHPSGHLRELPAVPLAGLIVNANCYLLAQMQMIGCPK